jgi:hypothetical protein
MSRYKETWAGRDGWRVREGDGWGPCGHLGLKAKTDYVRTDKGWLRLPPRLLSASHISMLRCAGWAC